MKIIKFRIWNKKEKKFYGPYTIEEIGDRGIGTTPDIHEWMQFTGLLDKNGKEIYEGDLFGKMGGDVERPEEYEIHAKVYFDEDLGAFCIDDQRGGWEYLADYLNKQSNEREVIGNIYENKDLLALSQ